MDAISFFPLFSWSEAVIVLFLLRNKEELMLMVDTKITSKRQITLPVSLMKKLHLGPGDSVTFQEVEGRIELKPRKKYTIRDYLSRKPRNLPSIKLSDEQINRLREQAWVREIKS